jgi:hypothetical protein
MEMLHKTAAPALDQLQAEIQGEVFVPGDAQYDAARQAWNLSVNQHPAVILVAHSAADIVAGVRYAQAANVGIAVQSTGHGVIRPADDSLLVITTPMTGVQVNAAAQTAWVEAGAKWGAVLEQAQAFGLTPLLGSSPTVGAVGYTLGGGMGWLARKYGLAIDSVIAFEVATAAGELVRTSQNEHADLFWGLRGGGGGFGIVTGMEIKLYPVATVYGGNLFYPIDQAQAVFTRYREWIKSAPEDLTSSVSMMNFPPIPALPDFLRGQSFVIVRGCFAGEAAEGEALLRYWRDWQTPILDNWRVMPFSEVASISADPQDPLPGLSTGTWLRDLSDETIATIMRYSVPQGGPAPFLKVEVRHAGGAIAHQSAQANAYSHRDSTLILQAVGITPTPDAYHALEELVTQFKHDLEPDLTGGVYMNFLEGKEARSRTPQGFSTANFQQLQALKARYDATNRFRHSYDIPPARETAEQ